MESPFLTLVALIFGVLISIFGLIVESQENVTTPQLPNLPENSPPPPPPLWTPLPPSELSPPPWTTLPPSEWLMLAPPPSDQQRSPPPPRPSPPPPSDQPAPSPSYQRPPPPHNHAPPPPPPGRKFRPPPPPESPMLTFSRDSKKSEGLNMGKKIGLLFVGIAAILQVGVVAFIVIRRRQLLMHADAY